MKEQNRSKFRKKILFNLLKCTKIDTKIIFTNNQILKSLNLV